MGRNQAKKKARTSGSSSARSEELTELKNELRAMETYMKDVSHLDGEAYETTMTMKEKLKQQYGF